MYTVSSFRRTGSIACFTALAVVASFVLPRSASAQARPALTRDTDNADLAPATFLLSVAVSNGLSFVVTVPAGKRLILDNISYSYESFTSMDSLITANCSAKVGNTFAGTRQLFPVEAPHLVTGANYPSGDNFQNGSFLTRAYFEAGESVYCAGQNSSLNPNSMLTIIAGHYVTP